MRWILAMAVYTCVTEAWFPWASQPLVPHWGSPQTRLIPGAPGSHPILRPPLRGFHLPTGTGVRPPPTTPKPSLLSPFASVLDPFGLFSEEQEARRVLLKKRKGKSPSTTEKPPPFVYFPEGGNGVCKDFAAGGGFNTYSFLSFLFSVANLIGHVANNVNNNLNNNNDNNNDNNNNLNNINTADSNSNVNNDNTVSIPPGMGRRRRHEEDIIFDQYRSSVRLVKEEEVVALVAMDFIRGLRSAMVIPDLPCALRNMCEVNRSAVKRGDLADVIAEVFSLALVESYPRHLPVREGVLLSAGAGGRRGQDCGSAHQRCSDANWLRISTYLDLDSFEVPPEALTETLGLPSLDSILKVTSFASGLDAGATRS